MELSVDLSIITSEKGVKSFHCDIIFPTECKFLSDEEKILFIQETVMQSTSRYAKTTGNQIKDIDTAMDCTEETTTETETTDTE